jgi:RNA polymerase subunit RPABC4/transcription elongation factor Spt4
MESMETTGVKQAREKVVNPNVVATSFSAPGLMSSSVAPALEPGAVRNIGYGMPCAKCRAYYPADMDACPICKSKERLSAKGNGRPAVAATASSHSDAAKLLAEERERLRELKSQIYAPQPQVPAATFRCALDQNHDGTTVEPAAVCHSCYGGMRQQVGRMETALHMEPKEAAKIVYEAVWTDTSDPDKTYYNAAVALLGELRKRAGIAK